MDIQKRLQELENELIDFSCYEDQLNDKEELLNCFNKLKEAINFIPCCTELKDKEAISFEEWIKHNYREGKHKYYSLNGLNCLSYEEVLQKYNVYKQAL